MLVVIFGSLFSGNVQYISYNILLTLSRTVMKYLMRLNILSIDLVYGYYTSWHDLWSAIPMQIFTQDQQGLLQALKCVAPLFLTSNHLTLRCSLRVICFQDIYFINISAFWHLGLGEIIFPWFLLPNITF
jgi:hypothetical protein